MHKEFFHAFSRMVAESMSSFEALTAFQVSPEIES